MFFASLRWHLHSINVIKLPIPTMQVTLYHIWKAPNKDITRRNLTGEIPPHSLPITLPFSSRTILPSIKIHHHKESNPTLDSMISYEARIHTLSVPLSCNNCYPSCSHCPPVCGHCTSAALHTGHTGTEHGHYITKFQVLPFP